MPKRPETPPISSETTLITIWNPWPPAIRISEKKGIVEEDSKKLVEWLACMIGVDNVFSLYWKPKDSTTVLVEIGEFVRYERALLGAHKWHDCFKKLSAEDKAYESRIYTCKLNYRKAEKLGWKEMKWESNWLAGLDKTQNPMVQFPYPKPSYCKLPEQIHIGDLCREIPIRFFPEFSKPQSIAETPPPKASALATPGTAMYQAAKAKGLPIPAERIKPEKSVSSVGAKKPAVQRKTQPIKKKSSEKINIQAMQAVLGRPTNTPSLPSDYATTEPNEEEKFDWFEEVEADEALNEWSMPPATWDEKPTTPTETTLTETAVDEDEEEDVPYLDSTADGASGGSWGAAPTWDNDESNPMPPSAQNPGPSRSPASKTNNRGGKNQSKPTAAWGKSKSPFMKDESKFPSLGDANKASPKNGNGRGGSRGRAAPNAWGTRGGRGRGK